MILFTGGSASVHAGISPPLGSRHAPPDQASPRTRHPPPGPGIPPGTEHAGRYGQRAGGTHPTGMQSCFSFSRLLPSLDVPKEFIEHNKNNLWSQCRFRASVQNTRPWQAVDRFQRNIPILVMYEFRGCITTRMFCFYSYADGMERTWPKRKNQSSERGTGKEPRVSSTTINETECSTLFIIYLAIIKDN